jgi:hypothetical protein
VLLEKADEARRQWLRAEKAEADLARLTERCDAYREALEYYQCRGLGACTEQRLKDGTCIKSITGVCGDIARAALALKLDAPRQE